MTASLDARLREIVTAHVVVGGHPDTMGIARAAYALARADLARDGVLHLERTVWDGSTRTEERLDMEAWVAIAAHGTLDRLLDDVLVTHDEAGQALLSSVWSECARANGGPDDEVAATYHWGGADRTALRRAIMRMRPAHLEVDAGQGSLL